MADIILFNKPFNVLSQFTHDVPEQALGHYIRLPGYYAAGRLDKDSEGLLLLTSSGKFQHQVSHPKFKLPKTYWAQVEGDISDQAISQLKSGVLLKDGKTRPASARRISEPEIWERYPPIRERKYIPTTWIELTISEGKNRQVRRMTAAVGFPTLRLIRASIGPWDLGGLQPGEYRQLTVPDDMAAAMSGIRR
ncbi:pseudouridine synthase [Pseudohongiella nitratireducens]|jgi:23S rRNA pseudouridine2457 synthase|uniref:Pseudouridine synthase n=1 Tax=Pseudohongiella nitratireducens TaxID=1768907 RepID=A0A917GKD5_9GAMM|nr:pseudouridine synthase [Pseudohongiella nitratireducens]MDF1622830.1 pseudouridine synthase [Pseudohongiella nitratireducens]GGG49410.1 pseudouridine synthase [Pseudohongiella nitratireducens]|tara:strand:- start:836 stop:1414 length:579 start_codon:yes stop_codon:yes gene_type:complete